MKFPLKFLSTSSGLTNKLGLLSLHARFNSALTPTECMFNEASEMDLANFPLTVTYNIFIYKNM